jgi:hypothetical protein
MSIRANAIAWGLILASGAVLTAQTGIRLVQPPRPGITLAEAWRPATASSDTKIIGNVIDIRHFPVAFAQVQLRNLLTGKIAQTATANDNGEYQFIIDEPSTYVVEMTMLDGYVLALSNAGSLARYETLQTVIQLPGRWDGTSRNMTIPQNPTQFLGMSAQTTMTAATLSMAVAQDITPTDPGEPVSPVK